MKKPSAQPSTANNARTATRTPLPSAESGASRMFEDFPQNALLREILYWRRQGVHEQGLARILVSELLLRISNLMCEIEKSFAGQPLVRTVPPDAPANQNRVNAYLNDYGRATKLLKLAVELARMTSSMTMATDFTPHHKKMAEPATEGQVDNNTSTRPSEGSQQPNIANVPDNRDARTVGSNSTKGAGGRTA
jgi:hypothetical protein